MSVFRSETMLDPPRGIRQEIPPERHEFKYIIRPRQAPEIREYLLNFCEPDAHARGNPPGYTVITLQLDSPSLALHLAKDRQSLNRFKLRLRTYTTRGNAPVFLEIKRKLNTIISKSRCRLPAACDVQAAVERPRRLPFARRREENTYLEFVRLTRQIGARPVVLIRYERESYASAIDNYARVTFDRRLCYRRTSRYDIPPRNGCRWRAADTHAAFERPFSGVILELKCTRDQPLWMAELIRRFDLTECGFCKYSAALNTDALFGGYEFQNATRDNGYF